MKKPSKAIKWFNLFFLNPEGDSISFTAVGALFGILVSLTIYIQAFWLGYEVSEALLNWSVMITSVLMGVRGAQGFSRYIGWGKNTSEGYVKKKMKDDNSEDNNDKPTVVVDFTPEHTKIGYFHTTDFSSGDGTEMSPEVFSNVVNTIKNLNILREEMNAPIIVTSGYRSEHHNRSVGGGKSSQHIYGRAADIKVKGRTPEEVVATIKRLRDEGKMERGGLGIYSNRVHYDTRGEDVFWDER